jgi:DNA-directed RNA polymerase subunit RPC12/RpoP
MTKHRPYDMGTVNGVRLTYINGNVFATPAHTNKKRNKIYCLICGKETEHEKRLDVIEEREVLVCTVCGSLPTEEDGEDWIGET